MNIGIGGIVSLGGGSSGGSGSTSGIQSINGQTGPAITITGVNGITVTAAGNVITINGASISGQTGTISGVSVNAVASYSALFSSLTSGIFSHNFNTRETIVQIYDTSSPPRVIFPDEIISENLNQTSVIFNRPQNGRIVIHAPSGVISAGSSAINKFSQSFTNVSSFNAVHNLGTSDVLIQVIDSNSPSHVIIPDDISINSINDITLRFNSARNGRVIIIG